MTIYRVRTGSHPFFLLRREGRVTGFVFAPIPHLMRDHAHDEWLLWLRGWAIQRKASKGAHHGQ